jgi:hypothetical protein
LRKRGSQTWETRSVVDRTRPAKQSRVQVVSVSPRRSDPTGAAPPKV